MAGEGSVSRWIGGFKAGDPEAARQLYERFFIRMVRLARQRGCGQVGGDADEEDVALSAIQAGFLALQQGDMTASDRIDLWQVLLLCLRRKVGDRIRYAKQKCRDINRAEVIAGEQVLDPNPSLDPAFEVEMVDECRYLLDMLGDTELKTIALLKLEENTNEEIAGELNLTLRTVERRLSLIRLKWRRRSHDA